MKFKTLFILLICTILIGIAHSLITTHLERPKLPEKVTLYLEDDRKICTLTLKEYILGRLFAECPDPLAPEAMDAAACAISTTVYFRLENGVKPVFGADLSDAIDSYLTPEEARTEYDNYEEMLPLYKAAAEYGCSHIMLFDNKPVYAPLCRLSAGATDDGGEPWLKTANTERDKSSKEFTATSAFSTEQVRIALRLLCPDAKLSYDYSSWFTNAEYLPSGTLKSINYGGCDISGKELADTLGLRSNALTIEYAEDRFVFTVRGIGNNIGMSLYTADKLALLGNSSDEILNYFYSNIKITETNLAGS